MEKENVEIIEEILKERIEENEELFSGEELKIIKDNVNIIEKIYLIGILDNNFNAIFNATSKKSYKKRNETK